MHKPYKLICIFFLLAFIHCQVESEDPLSVELLENQKLGPSRIISGDSLPPPREIKLQGMKGVPINKPKVYSYEIPYKYLNDEKALHGQASRKFSKGVFGKPKPLELITKTTAYKPERKLITSPLTTFIPNKTVKRLDRQEGFKPGAPYSVALDSIGQLWSCGTVNGLMQFDGTYAYYYSIDQGAPSNHFTDIAFDPNGNLWASLEDGLCFYDGESFTHYKLPRHPRIYDFRNGELWIIAQDKLYLLNSLNYTISEIVLDEIGTPNFVNCDQSGKVWIFSDQGFAIFAKERSDAINFEHYRFPESFPQLNILSMSQSSSHLFWMGTDNGLILLNAKDEKFQLTYYSKSAGAPTNLVGNKSIYHGMAIDDNGKLIMLVQAGGFISMDISQKPYKYTQHNKDDGIDYYSISLSKIGNQIWFCSRSKLHSIQTNPYKFWDFGAKNAPANFTCGTFDMWGRLWLGSYGNGIFMVEEDKEKGVLNFYQYNNQNGLRDSYIDDILGDQNGNLWLGLRVRGLSRIKLDATSPSGVLFNHHEENGFPADVVKSIIETDDGSIWCAIYEHDEIPKAGFAKLEEDGLLFYGKEHGLRSDDLMGISIDSKKQIWVNSILGEVSCYNLDDQYDINYVSQFDKDYSFIDNRGPLEIDGNDEVWMGFTPGNQLTKIGEQKDKHFILQRYTDSYGLNNTYVSSIFNDSKNRLWLAGWPDLLRGQYSKDENHKQIEGFKSYNSQTGLPVSGVNGNGIFESKENEIWVLGHGKVYWFNPDDFDADRPKPKTVIKDILLFDESIAWDKRSAIKLSNDVIISDYKFDSIRNWTFLPEDLSLRHDNNFISFDCVGTDLSKTESLEYSFRLNEKEGWSFPSENAKIFIGKLNPDHYNFQIKSRFKNEVWGPVSTYQFTIRPPWWKSWLAILAYFIIGLMLVYAIIKIRVSIALDKAKALEEARTKISSDLHDDVGSLLTGISMQSEFLAINPKENSKEDLEILGERSKVAMEKMRDIVWAMDASKDKYENLIDRMNHYLGEAFYNTSFSYDLDVSNVQLTEFLSPDRRQQIYMIFKESITNILKHSNGNQVSIQLSRKDNLLKLSIHDNGTSADIINTAGQGVKNMKERAEKLGGQLEVLNRDGFLVELGLNVKS